MWNYLEEGKLQKPSTPYIYSNVSCVKMGKDIRDS
jgi:hypothetical protein